MDSFDRRRIVVALLSIAVLMLGVMVLSASDKTAKPMNMNGDQLGRNRDETSQDYANRAQKSLEMASEPAFALVAFPRLIDANTAGDIAEKAGIMRVNAVLLGRGPALDLPEPTGNANRGRVISEQCRMRGGDPETIAALVVYAPGDQLRRVAASKRVATVEVLPPDAVWGRIGLLAPVVEP
ncbi:hypothetical protein CHUV2995_01947 [Corynebacterium diphtheriae subsp. lausannense]|nr:hypothetical protein CHUV2995_01947 [Corynebacterium diphtheriae subsp. lausannense]